LITAVLDANVLISGLISSVGPPGRILDAWMEGEFQLFVSPQIMDELKRVLGYPKIRQRLKKEQLTGLLIRLELRADQVPGILRLEVLTRDPSDNIYLACAIEAKAQYLITGNMDHFEEARAFSTNIHILAPRAFLEILEAKSE
jgi:putative PIN family toxin of toxin-antitoxin system